MPDWLSILIKCCLETDPVICNYPIQRFLNLLEFTDGTKGKGGVITHIQRLIANV